MKNLLKNRKGFTLAEILLVVAIIVILSGATVIGVASWVNQSQTTAHAVESKSAAFEADAVDKVLKAKGNVGSDPHETETLKPGEGDGKVEGNGNGGGNGGGEGNGNGGGNGGGEGNGEGGGNGNGEGGDEGGEGGSNTVNYNASFNGSGSKSVSVDSSKTIKSITIKWKNDNPNEYAQLIVTYKGGGNGNFYNTNNYLQVNSGESGEVTFTPQSNGQNLSGCSALNFSVGHGKFTIESYTIEYA